MKVFKTQVDESSKGIEITEENFLEATNNQEPYVQWSKKGQKSYFAVCPICDNPVQFVGLFVDDCKIESYAKHYRHPIKRLANFDEQAMENCIYFTGRKCDNPLKQVDKGRVGIKICRTMRDEFDKVVYFWEVLTGIKLRPKIAEQCLKRWIIGETWKLTYCTNSSLAISLNCATAPQNLIYEKIVKGSALHEFLVKEAGDILEFENVENSNKYVKIVSKVDSYILLQYNILPAYFCKTTCYCSTEKMTLQVICDYKGKRKFEKKMTIVIDSEHWNNILNLETFHRNQKLLDIAQEAFKGIDLDLSE